MLCRGPEGPSAILWASATFVGLRTNLYQHQFTKALATAHVAIQLVHLSTHFHVSHASCGRVDHALPTCALLRGLQPACTIT